MTKRHRLSRPRSRSHALLLLAVIAALVIGLTSAATPAGAAWSAGKTPVGALRVTVSGLPAGATPPVVVRGKGERHELTAPATVGSLVPGSYLVVPRAVAVDDTFYVPVDADESVAVTSGHTSTVRVDYVATGDTVVVNPANVVSHSRVSGVVSLVGLRAGTTRPRAGDFIVIGTGAQTPQGVFGQVRSVSGDVVRVRRTPLTSFVSDGQVDTAQPLRPRALRPAPAEGVDSVDGALVVDVDLDVPCGDGSTYSVTGTVSVRPSYDFSLAWSDGAVTTANYSATMVQSADLRASLDAAGSCAVEAVPLLDTPLSFAPTVVTTSGVPVVVTPQLQLYGAATADADGPTSASADLDQTTTAGFSYDSGTLTPSQEFAREVTASDRHVDGRAELMARVSSTLSLKLYDGVGPRLAFGSQLTLAAAEGRDPWWEQRSTVLASGVLDAKPFGLDLVGQSLGQDGATVAEADDLGPWLDPDGDGYPVPEDCAPLDPARNPGAEEVPGDGIDQDCDGEDAVVAGDGDVEVSLTWGDSPVDLDLYVTEPDGSQIWWFEPGPTVSGGQLDNDWGDGCAASLPAGGARETVSWPTGTSPDGSYQVMVEEWDDCGRSTSNWHLVVTVDGSVVVDRTGQGTMSAPLTFSSQ